MDHFLSFNEYFVRLSAYNTWANDRLYSDILRLNDDDIHRDIGLYFSSVFGTLKHMIDTDRAWQCLLKGEDFTSWSVLPPTDTTDQLCAARRTENIRIQQWIAGMAETDFDTTFEFVPWVGDLEGQLYRQKRRYVLSHLFNHQTHHRGQAHAGLTILGVKEPKPLDIMVWQIETAPRP